MDIGASFDLPVVGNGVLESIVTASAPIVGSLASGLPAVAGQNSSERTGIVIVSP